VPDWFSGVRFPGWHIRPQRFLEDVIVAKGRQNSGATPEVTDPFGGSVPDVPTASDVTTATFDKPAPDATANGTKPKETKRERFNRLVDKRMRNWVKRTMQVLALGDRRNYDPDPDTVDRIIACVTTHREAIFNAFTVGQHPNGGW
jgi:hypothetical protein